VLTVPLLVGTDGVEKMGKSLGNWIGIEEPPDDQFGKVMSIPDTVTGHYARLATDLPPEEVAALEGDAAAGGPAANRAKRRVAAEVVALYHGRDAAVAAERRFDTVHRQREVPDDVPEYSVPPGDPVHLPVLLVDLGFAASTSAARRLVDDGAVRVDGERLPAREYDLARDQLLDHVLAVGKRHLARLTS
jgi:tyrosyl-tRNA synthetase